MPLYEYVCTACGHDFEEMRKFNDPELRKCPKCARLKVQKKISLAGFQLKGAGWYKDGYAKSAPAADKPAKTESKSAEAKPECKAATSTTKACGGGACAS